MRPRGATTPRPTSCTRDFAPYSATTCVSRAPSSGPTGCASTSPTAGVLASEEVGAILTIVNTDVVLNEHVETIQTTKTEAESMGAVAFFGDKYGDRVRVVRAGRHSLEFCGGTHVDRLGDIGQMQIVSESSIGANTRRIEGVSGMGAYRAKSQMETPLSTVASLLKTSSRGRRARPRTALRATARRSNGRSRRFAKVSSVSSRMSWTRRAPATWWSRGSMAIGGEQLRTLAQDLQRRGRRVVVVVGTNEGKVSHRRRK